MPKIHKAYLREKSDNALYRNMKFYYHNNKKIKISMKFALNEHKISKSSQEDWNNYFRKFLGEEAIEKIKMG